jgi:hypothetical protein
LLVQPLSVQEPRLEQIIEQSLPGQSSCADPLPVELALHPPIGQDKEQLPVPLQVKLQPKPVQVREHAAALSQVQLSPGAQLSLLASSPLPHPPARAPSKRPNTKTEALPMKFPKILRPPVGDSTRAWAPRAVRRRRHFSMITS